MPKSPPPPPPPAIPPAPPAVPDAGLLTLHAAVDGRIGTPGKTCRNSDFLWQHYPRWHNRLEPSDKFARALVTACGVVSVCGVDMLGSKKNLRGVKSEV